MRAQDLPAFTIVSVCSLNRCYFFFVLRCLSLQTSGFPLKAGGSPTIFWLSRRDSTSSNTGVGFVLFLLLSSLAGFCTFVCGTRDFAPLHKDYTSASFVIHFVIGILPVGLGISVSVLSSLDAFAGGLPFETLLPPKCCLTQSYNLISLHLSCARAQLLSVPLSNRPFSC